MFILYSQMIKKLKVRYLPTLKIYSILKTAPAGAVFKIRGSSNGRTAAFEAVNSGSNPGPRASKK